MSHGGDRRGGRRAAVLLAGCLAGSALPVAGTPAHAAGGLTVSEVIKTVTLTTASAAVGLDCPDGTVPLSGGVTRANGDPLALRLASESVRTTNAVTSPTDYRAVVQMGSESTIDVTGHLVCAASDQPLNVTPVTGSLSWFNTGTQFAVAATIDCPDNTFALNASTDPTATADHVTSSWLVHSSPSADGRSWHAMAGTVSQSFQVDVPVVVHCLAAGDVPGASVEESASTISATNMFLTQDCLSGTAALAGGAYGSQSGTDPDLTIYAPRISQWHPATGLSGRTASANRFDLNHAGVISVALCAPAATSPELVEPAGATGRIATIPSNRLVDGETFTISDGAGHTVTFEFDADSGGVTVGRTAVPFLADETAATMTSRIVGAINTANLAVTATAFGDPALLLANDNAGAAGNVPITETVADTGFAVAGMSGGTDSLTPARGAAAAGLIATSPGSSLADGQTVTVDDGAGQTLVLEFDTDGSVGAGATAVTFTSGDSAATIRGKLVAAVNASALAVAAVAAGDAVLALGNQNAGVAGNVPIVSLVSYSGFRVRGMSGGHDPTPDLTIAKTHTGDFKQRQTGATYTITVHNAGYDPTSGTVTVVDTMPTGLTATAIAGTGWSCNLGTLTCTRSDALASAGDYPVLTIAVTVADDASGTLVNTATVSGGGDIDGSDDTATDPTTVAPFTPTTTAAACSPNPVRIGIATTCTATVTDTGTGSAPTGSVTWSRPSGGGTFGAPSCSLTPGGAASTCTTTYRPAKGAAGTQQLGAAYAGDAAHGASSASTSLSVLRRVTATSVRCKPRTVAHGNATVCRATLSDVSPGRAYPPTGKVRWSAKTAYGTFDHTACSLSIRNGTSSCRVTFTTRKRIRGGISVRARYAGDASHLSSSRRAKLTVT